MVNGEPFDHPYTDIVEFSMRPFTEAVHASVRSIDEYDEPAAIDLARSLVWDVGENPSAAEVASMEADLEALSEAIDRAEEFPARSPLQVVLDGDESLYTEEIRITIREINEEIVETRDDPDRGRKKLGAILWQAGWEPENLDELEAKLLDFQADWVWEK